MDESSRSRNAWHRWVSGIACVMGSGSLLAYFWTIPADGPAHPGAVWTLIVVPLVSGLVGVGFGVWARAWWWVAWNSVLVFAFPVVMLVGTLTMGP